MLSPQTERRFVFFVGVTHGDDLKLKLRRRAKLGQILCGAYEPVPVFGDVLGWAADLGDRLGGQFGGDQFDRVPGADFEIVGIGLLAWDVVADFAADTTIEVDLAPLLRAVENRPAFDSPHFDAINRANLQARFAASAVVGIDDRQ